MTRNSIDGLVNEWEPQLRRAFLGSISGIADAAQISAIEARLRVGDVEGALIAVGIDPVQFRRLDIAIAQAFEAGGGFTATSLPAARTSQGARLSILFDVRSPRAEQWLRDRSGTLIREIVDDQRNMVRQHLAAGLEAGNNPRTVALDLVGRVAPNGKRQGGAIGLTNSQEAWTRNFRTELQTLNPAALDRKLRDARFDRTVRRAINSDTPLSASEIDGMVASYRNRALKLRADSIARTETIRALNEGQVEAAQQAIAKGQVKAEVMTKVWIATGDGRTRDTHTAMHDQSVGINERFVSPSGVSLDYPGDPSAPAFETVNCRCTMLVRVDFLRGVR